MAKGPRWTAECNDAAETAKAILKGKVTNKVRSIEKCFSEKERQEITKKCNCHTTNGKQNLRRNFGSLHAKIKCWSDQIPDPKSNKRKSSDQRQLLVLGCLSHLTLVAAIHFSSNS